MKGTQATSAAAPTIELTSERHEQRLELLIDRLPQSMRNPVRWLRRPASRWARIPAGILLVIGGTFSILPLLGIWMLPLGLILLAEDTAILRRYRARLIDWVARRRPHWFASAELAVPAIRAGSDEGGGDRSKFARETQREETDS